MTSYHRIPMKPTLALTAEVRCVVDGCGWTFTREVISTDGRPIAQPSVGEEWAAHWRAAHDPQCRWVVGGVGGDRRCVLPRGHHTFDLPGTFSWTLSECVVCGRYLMDPVHAGPDHRLAEKCWSEPPTP